MNEAADLVALVAKLKEDHAKELEQRDLKHVGELSNMTDQISNLTASLDSVMKTSKEQLDNMSRAVRTDADEMTAIHDSVLGKLSILGYIVNSLHLSGMVL